MSSGINTVACAVGRPAVRFPLQEIATGRLNFGVNGHNIKGKGRNIG